MRLALGASLVLLAVFAFRTVGSLDIGFHLHAGRDVLAGKGIPHTDTYTYTVAGHPYVDTSWGFQVLAALAERVAGPGGLEALVALLALGTFGFVLATARLRACDPAALVVGVALAVPGIELRLEPRPEWISYLLLATLLYLLQRRAAGRRVPEWLFPAIHLLWANVHALFPLGWLAMAAFIAGGWWRDRRLDRRLVAALGASVAVTLVNPFGIHGTLAPLALLSRFSGGNPFAREIAELASPFALHAGPRMPFSPWLPLSAALALGVLAVLGGLSRRAWSEPASVLVLAMGLGLAAGMMRNLPLVAVTAVPVVAWALPLQGLLDAVPRLGERARVLVPGLSIVVTAALGLLVVHQAYYSSMRRIERFGVGWNRLVLPLDAVEAVGREGIPGRPLNHLNLGGWLGQALPEPVFLDGRLEVMGESLFSEYLAAFSTQDALEECAERRDASWIVFPPTVAPDLLARVSRDPRWTFVHGDPAAVVFVRTGAAVSMTEAPLPPEDVAADPRLRSLPGLFGNPRPSRLRWWLRGLVRTEEYPQADAVLGLVHLLRGELPEARACLVRAVRESDGAWYELDANLGATLVRMGDKEGAAECYRAVLADAPDNGVARKRLDEIAAGGTVPARE